MTISADTVIIGAGLAGCATAHFLAREGLTVRVMDSQPTTACGASGNPEGLVAPYLTREETPAGILYSEAFDEACSTIKLLNDSNPAVQWRNCGALQLPSTRRVERLIDSTDVATEPRRYSIVSAHEASELSGVEIHHQALFYPDAGTVSPRGLCAAYLAAAPNLISFHGSTRAIGIDRDGDFWNIRTSCGEKFQAQVIVVTSAYESNSFQETSWIPLERVRGQILLMPSLPTSRALRTAVCFDGYILPAADNHHLVGASYDHGWFEERVCPDRQRDMLNRITKWIPSISSGDGNTMQGRVSFRTSTHDRLPYVGPVPDVAALEGARPSALIAPPPLLPGLYVSAGHGSRGILSTALAGRILAKHITGNGADFSQSEGIVAPRRYLKRLLAR